jgi:hypothetical protein
LLQVCGFPPIADVAKRAHASAMRRDDPHISDRPDEHADALSTPADPNAVLDALKDTQNRNCDFSTSPYPPGFSRRL